MGVHRYIHGISLLMFNSIAHKWAQQTNECRVEHEKQNSISTSNHVLFCLSYKHNSPLLRRKAHLINEWK